MLFESKALGLCSFKLQLQNTWNGYVRTIKKPTYCYVGFMVSIYRSIFYIEKSVHGERQSYHEIL
jgi:hypothetical protein